MQSLLDQLRGVDDARPGEEWHEVETAEPALAGGGRDGVKTREEALLVVRSPEMMMLFQVRFTRIVCACLVVLSRADCARCLTIAGSACAMRRWRSVGCLLPLLNPLSPLLTRPLTHYSFVCTHYSFVYSLFFCFTHYSFVCTPAHARTLHPHRPAARQGWAKSARRLSLLMEWVDNVVCNDSGDDFQRTIELCELSWDELHEFEATVAPLLQMLAGRRIATFTRSKHRHDLMLQVQR
jgi:hypothetical protein